jgi:23S rRNA (cytidine1920-2'-O)/16S rRNA (cytidine1409-2'-O)-methyltransferase
MGDKVRLDRLLVDRGLAPSRERARERIEAGEVLVDGIPATRPAAQVDRDRDVRVRDDDDPRWVGRGARKLAGVLGPLGVDPNGLVCADLGASTGGFTDVLLRAGAARVYAIDVGRNQLHERVAGDGRVVVMDEVNVRYLERLPEPVDLVVADLAFIALAKVLPAVARILRVGGAAVVLVKPQFEVGPDRVGAGGVVRDPAARDDAIRGVRDAAVTLGFAAVGGMDSPVAGARAGNVEHFLHLVLTGPAGKGPDA